MTTPDFARASSLPRRLGLWSAVAVLVGSTIGSGIFRSPAGIADKLPGPLPLLAIWLTGGIFALCGALTLAEVAGVFPRTGGVYVFIRESWGRLPAFLFGWSELVLIRAAALGAISTTFSEYFIRVLGYDPRVAPYSRYVHYVNASGHKRQLRVSQVSLNAEAGTIFRLKHGERLYPNGRVDLSNIDVHYRPTDNTDPFQTDIFITNGKGTQVFSPIFNYKGFQYIEVTSSKPFNLTKENLTGYFMHSDVPPVGSVRSSNPIIDKIWSATNNSYLSNLFGYPTDCPQREKNGWTGDAHIAIETGLYNFDGITIYAKWMADHRDEQQPNGVLPSIIPTDGWGYEWGNGPDWTSTIALIPWNIYLFYGDSKILTDCYDNIKRYVDHITSISPSGLTTWGLGDWVPVKSKSPVELTSTAYYFVDATILSKAAKLLGKQSDHEKYAKLAARIKTAFNKKYLNSGTGIYGQGIQTELSVPLYWGLVPDELKSKVAANLAKRVEADSQHIDVGLLGTKAILNALSENGYAGLAYKVASQETFPSWGWWMVNGATTLYENWPIDAKSDISMNHIMFGEIGAWLYKGVGRYQT